MSCMHGSWGLQDCADSIPVQRDAGRIERVPTLTSVREPLAGTLTKLFSGL